MQTTSEFSLVTLGQTLVTSRQMLVTRG